MREVIETYKTENDKGHSVYVATAHLPLDYSSARVGIWHSPHDPREGIMKQIWKLFAIRE